jgi:probable rRNA maturation factor
VTDPASPAPVVELAGRSRFAVARGPDLPRWLQGVVRELAPEAASFAVRFVGDREMRRLNRVFRGKDATTDVLSFPGDASPEGRHLGDVVISVPQAVRQAAELGHRPERELRLLLLHGVLHCLGHDHESDDGEMGRLERRLRRRFLAEA